MFNQEISLKNQVLGLDTKHQSTIAFMVKTIVGSAIMAISAQIVIPLPLVPITGQTLGLTIVALSMGYKAGTSAIILYLVEGALGFPVFSAGTGSIVSLLGPTGGYLWGYIPAAFIMGYFADKGCLNSFVQSTIAVSLGTIITFAFGLAQLSLFVPNTELLNVGLIPFILGGIIKSIVIIMIVPTVYRYFSKIK